MHVVRAAPDEVRHYGNFVIDSPDTVEPLILDWLTDRDKGQIAYLLGIGSYPPPRALPLYVAFQLYGIAPFGQDYENRNVDYKTDNRHRVWINRNNR